MKVDRAAEKYRTSHDAMLAISDPSVIPKWNDSLPVLKVEDIHRLSEALLGDSEGRRCPSWIWTRKTGVSAESADVVGDKGTYASSHPFAGANYASQL